MNMTSDLKNGKAVTGLNAAVVTDWVFDLDKYHLSSTIQPVSESCGTDDRIYHGPF